MSWAWPSSVPACLTNSYKIIKRNCTFQKLPSSFQTILLLYLSYFIIIQYLFQTLSLQCTNSNIAATAKCNRTKHCKMIWSLLVPTNIPKLTKQPPGPSLLFCWGAMNNLWSYHLMTSDTEWRQKPLFQNLPGKQIHKKSSVVTHSLAKEHYKLLSLQIIIYLRNKTLKCFTKHSFVQNNI